MTSVDGLITGLDTKNIVSQLMKIERLPQTMLTKRRSREEDVSQALSGLRTSVLAIRDLARSLRTPTTWQALTATASSDAVSVAARTGRITGSVQVKVEQTAAAAAIYSDTVPSLDTVVAAGGSVFSHAPARSIGFDSIKGNGIPIGDLPITVTQATAPATITAGAAPSFPIELTSADNSLTITVDGMAQTVTVKPGPYESKAALSRALVDAVATNPGLSGKVVFGSEPDGRLRLSTVREGSAAQLAITGGTAMATLGFQVTGPVPGTDGSVQVGTNGPITAVTDTTKGTTVTLAAAQGSLTATMAGPLRAGTVQAGQRSFGTGTLGEVVDVLNNAGGLGYTATAVNIGSGYRLQLTGKQTGASSVVDIDQSQFSTSFNVLSTGRDAELSVVGDDPTAGYRLTSSTNTFKDVIPGVDVTARRIDATPVTINVTADRAAAADKVASLIEAVNDALKKIGTDTAVDPKTGRGSVLTGNSAVRRAAQELIGAIVDPLAAEIGSAGQVGIGLNRDGSFTFDRSKFLEAVGEDPAGIAAAFSTFAGGTEPGILDRVASVADAAAALGSGYLTSARDAANDRTQSYTRQIDAYETRMVLREAQLRRTYASLETAMSGLQNQSNWLGGQLKGLSGDSK